MHRRAAAPPAVAVVIAAAIAIATVVPACSSSGRSAAPTTTTTAPTVTTTTVPATVPRAPASSPQEAATLFVTAWRDGNQLAASTIALPAAVNAAFAAGQPSSVQNRGCNRPPPDSPVLCVYRTDGGDEVQLRIAPEGDGWVVEQAIVTPAG